MKIWMGLFLVPTLALAPMGAYAKLESPEAASAAKNHASSELLNRPYAEILPNLRQVADKDRLQALNAAYSTLKSQGIANPTLGDVTKESLKSGKSASLIPALVQDPGLMICAALVTTGIYGGIFVADAVRRRQLKNQEIAESKLDPADQQKCEVKKGELMQLTNVKAADATSAKDGTP